MSSTKVAFDDLRRALGSARLPPQERIMNQGELIQMQAADGLCYWADGPEKGSAPITAPPLLDKAATAAAHLWVVRPEDVVHAPERCAFGRQLPSGVIKHTNLTGGAAAFSGGELIFLDERTIVVNGCSGRYGPRSKAELDNAVRAFAQSGYGVWSMGFDDEANRPAPFLGIYPEWVNA